MSEERFTDTNEGIYDNQEKRLYKISAYEFFDCETDEVVDLLNELVKEKDDWKNNCLKSVSENSILWNEIFILREQGAEPSDAFKNYLNNLKNKHNKLQGDFE